MTKMTRTAVTLTAFLTVVALSSSSALADTAWQKNHPRREQVNHRLAKQNARIKNEVKEGDLTHAQAAQLHKSDRQIRHEERLMAKQNGGHLTKQEQKTLNQQENGVSSEIGR